MYSNSLDVVLRMLMSQHTKFLEKDADLYVIERGFGVVFKEALVRSFSVSLDNLFVSWLDDLLHASHPDL